MENTQANSILEKMHPYVSNLIHSLELKDIYLYEYYNLACIVAADTFVVQIIYHTLL